MADPIVLAEDLQQTYFVKRSWLGAASALHAVAGVSFSLMPGKTLAVVGESGSGKSTLARMVTMIERPSAGRVLIDGVDMREADALMLRQLRSTVQIVFQNPFGSLNPRQTVLDALIEPLEVNYPPNRERNVARAIEMMRRVGLRPEYAGRYPHMFSGGQRQRIAIARALMLQPKVLVLDEPVSALDLSIRAQILNLLAELQDSFGLAYLFISHDLSVVKHVADDVMVLYLGRSVEYGVAAQIFDNPQHPYTRALLSATPVADPERARERIVLQGELPSPFSPPSGCVFHPRCPWCFEPCPIERPVEELKRQRLVACWAVPHEEGGSDLRQIPPLKPSGRPIDAAA
jgi:dipeptide transport system ATP-binding protein